MDEKEKDMNEPSSIISAAAEKLWADLNVTVVGPSHDSKFEVVDRHGFTLAYAWVDEDGKPVFEPVPPPTVN